MTRSVEDFMKTATNEQKDILFKLGELAEQEQKISNEINKIYSSTKSGVYSSDGFSLSICEDKDDAMVLSAKPRQELKRVKEQIKLYMIKAKESEMSDVGIIQRNYEHYAGKSL